MNSSDSQSETRESIGRIEVAPEVIATIAYYATMAVDGVARTVSTSSGRFRRATAKFEGVVLTYEGQNLILDIHIWVEPGKSMLETSTNVQKAVSEAMDQMVGIGVEAVNIHVENVSPVHSTSATSA